MANMVKTYVLVDEDAYRRKFETPSKASSSKPQLPNPFQNPHVERAKNVKRDMYEVGRDKSLNAEQATRLFRQMMNEYEARVGEATGKRKSRIKRSPPMSKETPSQANPGTDSPANTDQVTETPKRPVKRPASPDPKETGLLTLTKPKRREPLKALAREKVPRLLGGHLSESDIDKSYPLLNEMFKVGLIHGNAIAPLQDSAFKMTAERARTSIRDTLLNSPDRRSTTATEADNLVKFLKRKGVQTTLSRPTTRKFRREKRQTPVA